MSPPSGTHAVDSILGNSPGSGLCCHIARLPTPESREGRSDRTNGGKCEKLGNLGKRTWELSVLF